MPPELGDRWGAADTTGCSPTLRRGIRAAAWTLHDGRLLIFAGGAAVYLVAISFIHRVNQNSLRDRLFLARLVTAAVLASVGP